MTASPRHALARSAIYELLSLAFLYPRKGTAELVAAGAQKTSSTASDLGWEQARGALEKVSQSFGAITDDALVDEHTQVFGHSVSSDCPPYEGEYGQAHVFQKSQTLADLSTFYGAFGVATNPELKDRLDHVSVELEFMHLLTLKEAHAQVHGHGEDKVQLCRKAQEAFLENHLAPWITAFAHRLRAKAGAASVYAPVAQLLDVHIDRELREFQLSGTEESSAPSPSPAEGDQESMACPIETESAQEA